MWQYGFCMNTNRRRFNVFNFHLGQKKIFEDWFPESNQNKTSMYQSFEDYISNTSLPLSLLLVDFVS